ncbi:MAG: serpin family protein [Verrucomicrobia bacterium]|nr:serpin family protein [Verrucomicrobiota bacterium]
MRSLCTALFFSLSVSSGFAAEELTKEHTQFAFSLYNALDTSDKNTVFSPYSIATCLSMVYLGARDDTAIEIQKALHLTLDRKELAQAAKRLATSLPPSVKPANALWLNKGTFLLTDFRHGVEEEFKASLSLLDFSKPANAAATINQWTLDATGGKIQNLLSQEEIDGGTRLVLTSALYFEGAFKTPFDEKNTAVRPFHPTPDTSISVPTMEQVASLPYVENDLFQAAALPFSESSLSLVILLPKSAENFSPMVEDLPDSFGDWLSKLEVSRLKLTLPKFTYVERLDLKEALQALGIEEAFSTDANFAGIDGRRDLVLSKILHESYFALDESGVTAAAATHAAIGLKSALEEKPPTPFCADHPFLFFLVDLNSQEVIFMGKFCTIKT